VRVLLLSSRLSDRGGADRWLLGVLARLQPHVETLLAVGYEDRALPTEERVRVGPRVRIKGLDRRGLGRTSPSTVAQLRRLIDSFEPDVIHVNDLTEPSLLELVAASGRAVHTVQDHRFFCPGRGKVDLADRLCFEPMGGSCLRCFEDEDYGRSVLALTDRRRSALDKMNRVTVLSRYMAHELSEVGVSPRRIVVIPPFVDGLAPARAAVEGEFHLMAGRLSVHKGVAVALAAARLLRGDLPLVIAGEGPLAASVEEQAQAPGSRVRFVGWADRRILGGLLERARSLWLPSLWAEPFGIVGLEALAYGVPVVASDVGGVPEWLVSGKCGFLVEPGSATQLARAANRLGLDFRLAAELGCNGRMQVACDFAPDAIMARLLQLYADVAGQRARVADIR
jgi:glycosyltransferase involved in cell wall biosynthesis